MLRDDVGELPEFDAVVVMESIAQQVEDFWREEVRKENALKNKMN